MGSDTWTLDARICKQSHLDRNTWCKSRLCGGATLIVR